MWSDAAVAMATGDERKLLERKMCSAFAFTLFGAAFGGQAHGIGDSGNKVAALVSTGQLTG